MDYILDNPETDKKLQNILRWIQSRKNGEISELMSKNGITYKTNWGVSITEIRNYGKYLEKDHLLALKLWNKNWRETMILATLVDNPDEVTEEQMDFMTKNFGNIEIAEQTSANLWVKSRFAFVKALEWCRGKKFIVKFTGIHLAGRLALISLQDPDEMFEPFFEEFFVLAKDPKLFNVLCRTLTVFQNKSGYLKNKVTEFTQLLLANENETAKKLGREMKDILMYD